MIASQKSVSNTASIDTANYVDSAGATLPAVCWKLNPITNQYQADLLSQCTDTATLNLQPAMKVSLDKTASTTGALPIGGPVTYTVTVTNTGTSMTSGQLVDALPANLTKVSETCQVTDNSGALTSCSIYSNLAPYTDPSTNLIPPGGKLIYTLNATVNASIAAGTTITNNAIWTPTTPARTVCSAQTVTATNCSASVQNSTGFMAVTQTKTATVDTGVAYPGSTITYTVKANNATGMPVTSGTLADTWPTTGLSGPTGATCVLTDASNNPVASQPASCLAAQTLQPGETLTYTASGTIGTSVAPGTVITNTATWTPDYLANTTCNGALGACSVPVSNTVSDSMAVTLTKTAVVDTGLVYPGSNITYTVKVSNTTTKPVTSGTLTDAWPTAQVGAPTGATCVHTDATSAPVATQPTSCFDPVTLLPGDVLTYTAKGTVIATATAGTVITNTATWTPDDLAHTTCNGALGACSVPVNHTVSDSMAVTLTKTAVVDTGLVYPGSNITYTVKVSNTTTKPVTSGKLADAWPTAEIGAPTGATCVHTDATSAPVATQPTSCFDPVTLLPGDVLTYTAKGTVIATATAGTVITNTATWTPDDLVHTTCNGALGACSVPVNHTVSDSMAVTLTKTAVVDTGFVYPGSNITYTVKVSNTTTKPVTSGTLADTWPTAEVGAPTGATCVHTDATSAPVATQPTSCFDPVTLLPGDVLTYTAKGTVTAAAGTTITNTATWTPDDLAHTTCNGALGACSVPVNHTVSDTMAVTLTKTATPSGGTVYPGATIDYVVTVTNATGKPATSGTLSDAWPTTGVGAPTAVTCELKDAGGTAVATQPATCFDPVTLQAGDVLTYKARGTVVNPAPAAITNTATWTPDDTAHTTCNGVLGACSVSVNHSASDTMAVTLTKTATPAGGTVYPGATIDYVVTVANATGKPATAGTLSDAWPTTGVGAPTAVTCELKDAGGAAVATQPSNCFAPVTLQAGDVLTYKARGTVVNPAPAAITNTATWTPADLAHTTCNGVLGACSVSVNHGGSAFTVLSLTHTAIPDTVAPGGKSTFTIVATNNSGQAITDGVLTTDSPANLSLGTWTCTASGGAMCPKAGAVTKASGPLNLTALSLPVGGSLTFTAEGTLGTTLKDGDSVTLMANLNSATAGTTCLGGTALPCVAPATVNIKVAAVVSPAPIPVDARWMLMALSVLLAMAAAAHQQRARKGMRK